MSILCDSNKKIVFKLKKGVKKNVLKVKTIGKMMLSGY